MVWGVQGYSTYWRCYSPTKSYPTLWVKFYMVIIIKKAREFIKHLYWGIELGADIFWDTIIYSHVVVILSQNLAGNDLGSRGARLISDSLRKNRTITKLNISGNAVLTLYSVVKQHYFCCHHWFFYVKIYLLFIRITDVKKLKMFSFKTDTIIHISLYTYGCKFKSRCRTESHLIPKLYLLSFFDLFKTLFQNQFKQMNTFFYFQETVFRKEMQLIWQNLSR